MTFLGPHAESPPKNTFGWDDAWVKVSTTGIPHLSKSIPALLSIHGKLFSWPIAIKTSSASIKTRGSPVGTNFLLPFSIMGVTFSKFIPFKTPFSTTNSMGT